ncbi:MULTISPECIES: hypothetical protein [unclassified Sphingomonas]|uniref:hypothetical protein n=1 Tax=unclassified Sphingomonas TaxID=196159 RepID=UPI00226A2B4F|nr:MULTISPECIES: hypothetical protein [unclassified Sphingomonas]
MDEQEAARSLDMMRATRGVLAARTRWSLARHAAVGVLLGGLIAGYALPGSWPVVIVVVCLAAAVAIVARDRSRDGFFVNGYRPGRTRQITFVLVAIAFAGLVSAIALKERYGLDWAPVAIGIVLAIVATIVSVFWERVYRQELEELGRER